MISPYAEDRANPAGTRNDSPAASVLVALNRATDSSKPVVPLNAAEWLTVLALSVTPTVVCEGVKYRRRRARTHARRLVRHRPRRFAP